MILSPVCFIENFRLLSEHISDDRRNTEPLWRRPRGSVADRKGHNPLAVSRARKDCFSTRYLAR